MAYQIKQLAELAGVSVRTLRYYDQIGLLKPAALGANGYRLYEREQVDRLQQICLYRTLRLPLATIKKLLDQPQAQRLTTLEQQYQQLRRERAHLDQLLTLVQTTIQTQRGGVPMTDANKFEAFKAAQLSANEKRYGDEIKQRYGEATVAQANAKYADLDQAGYQRMQAVEADLIAALKAALKNATLTSENATKIYELHRQWLSFTWPHYTVAMHRGLAATYLADERFTAYYDQRAGIGATKLLVESIQAAAHD